MPVPEERPTRVLDPRSLRGLAHPLRMRLLNELRRNGPATASQLAAKLGESSGATSYHLRQLGAYGFVEDAPEQGKGRERWWRAMHEGVQLDETLLLDPDPTVRGAAAVFMHELATVHSQELSTFIATRHEWSEEWYRASDMSDWTLRLTPELAAELTTKVHALVDTYRAQAVPEGTPEAEQVRVHSHVFPIRTD
ncbi:ArsR/SmtB family transcription factor [Streptomyces dysideae]|uniref:ArsR family transcriptional regulator n=1 Tax=Streptomyces dysideae TaxID=909626 RepID=A0A101UWW4_9ACTN|nr:helix-turn-helix domain-containing protein [Streptomyces dysideae]KUO18368.1 ArsR family transcriptional regulator [Streptomyces dysideae]